MLVTVWQLIIRQEPFRMGGYSSKKFLFFLSFSIMRYLKLFYIFSFFKTILCPIFVLRKNIHPWAPPFRHHPPSSSTISTFSQQDHRQQLSSFPGEKSVILLLTANINISYIVSLVYRCHGHGWWLGCKSIRS